MRYMNHGVVNATTVDEHIDTLIEQSVFLKEWSATVQFYIFPTIKGYQVARIVITAFLLELLEVIICLSKIVFFSF